MNKKQFIILSFVTSFSGNLIISEDQEINQDKTRVAHASSVSADSNLLRRVQVLESTITGPGTITSPTITITSTTGDTTITSTTDTNITSGDNTKIESTDGDVDLWADTDASSTGKINIKSGTTSAAATAAGEIGLCALHDIVVKSEDGDVIIKSDENNSATMPAGKIMMTAGTVTFSSITKGDVAIGAANNTDLQAVNNVTVQSVDQDVRIRADIDGNATGTHGKVVMTAGAVSFSGLAKGDVAIGAANSLTVTGTTETLIETMNVSGTGNAGDIKLTGGTGGTSDGKGGDICLDAGAGGTTNGDGGAIKINGGLGTGTGDNGQVRVTTGGLEFDGTGSNPPILLAGDIGIASSNELLIHSENDITICSRSGVVNIEGLAVDNVVVEMVGGLMGTNAGATTNDDGDDIKVISGKGDGTGDGGDVIIRSEVSTGSGNDGNISITTGTTTFTTALDGGDIGLAATDKIIIKATTVEFDATTVTGLTVDSIMGANATVAGNPGGNATATGGAGLGSGDGGKVVLTGGVAGVAGDGGNIELTASAGGTTSGNGGAVLINSGAATTSGVGGAVSITAGASIGTDMDGADVSIIAGDGTATNADGGDIKLTAGSKAGSGADGDIVLEALSQNINLTRLILHVLMSARIAPVAKSGSATAVLPNFDNSGVSNVMYSGGTVSLTIDRDAATLTVAAVSGISSGPDNTTLRIGDGVVSTLTTTTGSKDITIEWLSNGVVEVYATP